MSGATAQSPVSRPRSGTEWEAELAVARRAASAAGALLHDAFRSGIAPEYKGRKDLVTEADRSSETLVRRVVAEVFPDDLVVGEEGAHPDEAEIRGRRRWYVDPLDGTTNFVKGLDRWAVSVAFCAPDDAFAAAAIDRPVAAEQIWATRGGGAWLADPGTQATPVHPLADPEPHDGLTFLGPFPLEGDVVPRLAAQSLSIRVTGSTVSDLADVALGRGELHLGSGQGRWDVAAGTLVVAESGRVVTRLDGSRLAGPSDNIVAASPRVHAATMGMLRSAGA